MESMIKIDNGVSKKAMDEVAEVVTNLFKAANDYDVGEDNLGRALKLIGKTIKQGDMTISHCNLTVNNTEPETRPSTICDVRNAPEPDPNPNCLSNKINCLRKLAANAWFDYEDIPTEGQVKVSVADGSIKAYVTYAKLRETAYEDLNELIPKIS